MIAASELERRLRDLHAMATRLSPPLNQRPGLFLDQKDALRAEIEQLLRDIGARIRETPRSFCVDHVDAGHSALRHRGRTIPIERRRPHAQQR